MKLSTVFFTVCLIGGRAAGAYAQQAGADTASGADWKVQRFSNKTGNAAKKVVLEQEKGVRVRISKDQPFDPSKLDIKISGLVAQAIEELRKGSKQDVELYQDKSVSYDAFARGFNGTIVETVYRTYAGYTVGSKDKPSKNPLETRHATTVYDANNNKVLELDEAGGWAPVGSNTLQFFIVTAPDGRQKIINRGKETLTELPFHPRWAIFSPNDRYILLGTLVQSPAATELAVYDTKENKLEPAKLTIPGEIFTTSKRIDISEPAREITIQRSAKSKATFKF